MKTESISVSRLGFIHPRRYVYPPWGAGMEVGGKQPGGFISPTAP